MILLGYVDDSMTESLGSSNWIVYVIQIRFAPLRAQLNDGSLMLIAISANNSFKETVITYYKEKGTRWSSTFDDFLYRPINI